MPFATPEPWSTTCSTNRRARRRRRRSRYTSGTLPGAFQPKKGDYFVLSDTDTAIHIQSIMSATYSEDH
jgi:hypothetical protein